MRTSWNWVWVTIGVGAFACAGRSLNHDDESNAGGENGTQGGASGASGAMIGQGGDTAGGSGGRGGNAGVAGRGGSSGKAGSGGTTAGGTGGQGGTAGAGGEPVCSCTDVSPFHAQCDVPLEMLCCARDPVTCHARLEDLLSNVSEICQGEADGYVADCADGTTELVHNNYTLDFSARVMFDQQGRTVGKNLGSSQCPDVLDACGVEERVDFATYNAGNLETRPCVPKCELCPNERYFDDTELPSCLDDGPGGAGGEGGGGQGGLGG